MQLGVEDGMDQVDYWEADRVDIAAAEGDTVAEDEVEEIEALG